MVSTQFSLIAAAVLDLVEPISAPAVNCCAAEFGVRPTVLGKHLTTLVIAP
jgi:hypothetical protein